MNPLYTLVFLMFVAVLLVGAAQKLKISYPIALVLGGTLLGFIPGLSSIDFDPRILLVIVLPPILFYASYSISFKEFTKYFSDIFLLAIVLVIITTLVVALLFKWLFPDLSWGLAFAFGAIVSPPDAVSATSVLKRFNISSRLRTILEGESLINDATALVIYKFSVLAIVTGSFSWKSATVEIFYAISVGILIGIILGYILNKISIYLNPVLSVVYSFIIPYISFCFADFVGASGVLAVVTSGLLGAYMLITQFNPLTRVLGWAFWDIIIILLNCFIFILIGLEFRILVEKIPYKQLWIYSAYGCLITFAVIMTRFVVIFSRRILWHLLNRKDSKLARLSKIYFLHAIISSWAGMRGIVSLTAALALPLGLLSGVPLPGREIVIFLSFIVIFLTLIIPGLTLPLLIEWLKIHPIQTQEDLTFARKKLADIAKQEIHKMHATKKLKDDEKELLCMYFHSRHKITEIFSSSEEHIIEQVRHHVIQKQREYLVEMWIKNEVDDSVIGHLERELDIEETHILRGDIT